MSVPENTGRQRGGTASGGASPEPQLIPWPATIAFIVIAMALAWLVALPLWLGDGLDSPAFTLVASAMMYTPALAAVIVILVLRPVPRGRRLRFLGVWPLRPAGRVIGMTVLGLFLPILLMLASMLLAAAFGWITLDLTGFSGYAAVLAAAAPTGTPLPDTAVVVVASLVALPLNAVFVAFLTVGEELGWRGFLVPALQRIGTWPALVLSGAIWGAWHAPLILLGYNFDRTDVTGLLLMVVGAVMLGVVFGWLRLRSASVWPAVLAHAAFNAAAGMYLWFVAAGTTFDPALAGPLGVAAWIVCAVVIAVLVAAGQFRKRPALAANRQRPVAAPPAPPVPPAVPGA